MWNCRECNELIDDQLEACWNCGTARGDGSETSPVPADPVSESTFDCAKCGYNLTGTAIGGQCPECGTDIDDSLRAHVWRSGDVSLPRLSYVGPILVTLFCCVIAGIVSIVYTAKGNTGAAVGNVVEYESCKKSRNGWMLASLIIGFLLIIGQVVMRASGP